MAAVSAAFCACAAPPTCAPSACARAAVRNNSPTRRCASRCSIGGGRPEGAPIGSRSERSPTNMRPAAAAACSAAAWPSKESRFVRMLVGSESLPSTGVLTEREPASPPLPLSPESSLSLESAIVSRSREGWIPPEALSRSLSVDLRPRRSPGRSVVAARTSAASHCVCSSSICAGLGTMRPTVRTKRRRLSRVADVPSADSSALSIRQSTSATSVARRANSTDPT
mmetsp:Transcript_28712/g.67310  ORF Transcript_28712/g.67310 Transcript_28712/m.67310 type:complete len:226 (-) Transcript_28712:795-1472(-)